MQSATSSEITRLFCTFATGLTHQAGDCVAILPQNPPDLVSALLKRLGLNGGEVMLLKPAGSGPPTEAPGQ